MSQPRDDIPAAWQGILDDDERILWQGQPAPGVKLEFSSPMEAIIAVFFIGFSIFWMDGAAQAGGAFWMFGLIFFGIGLYKLIGQHIWQARLRRNTFYTLTSKRALVGKTSLTGERSLDSYPIGADTKLSFEEKQGLASIHFSTQQVTISKPTFIRINGLPINSSREVTQGVGFEMLPDGRSVFALMRKMQQDAATDE